MPTRLFAAAALLALSACGETKSANPAPAAPTPPPAAQLAATCVSNVVNMLRMLHTMNSNGQQPSSEQGSRIGAAARAQCECAQGALAAEDFAGLDLEVTTSQQDLSSTTVSVRESSASTRPAEWRERVNALLEERCPPSAL